MDYNNPDNRKLAWTALKQCPAFKDFFLDYYVQRQVERIKNEILETADPESIPMYRKLRELLEAFQKNAAQAIDPTEIK